MGQGLAHHWPPGSLRAVRKSRRRITRLPCATLIILIDTFLPGIRIPGGYAIPGPAEGPKVLGQNAPEAGPVFTSSQLKYRSHGAILVVFGCHLYFSERDFSGSGQNGEVAAPPPSLPYRIGGKNRSRRLLCGGEGGNSARCFRHQLAVFELDLGEGVRAVTLGMYDHTLRGELDVPQKITARPRRFL